MPFVDWDTLAHRLGTRACTPFIGAGASAGFLPLGRSLAEELASEFGYPMPDRNDLSRVSEFVAVTKRDGMIPKERIAERVLGSRRPDFSDPDDVHRALAHLDLPIYLTTNYDDFMFEALRAVRRDPRREICRWNRLLEQQPSVFDEGFNPTPANPVVFHLHVICRLAFVHGSHRGRLPGLSGEYLEGSVDESHRATTESCFASADSNRDNKHYAAFCRLQVG